ncbi:MT-A70 family methyltransferase [Methylobacterium brachythecii]|uniref:DNA methyltransferase n=1 Tax=Methylobacterium brachythecii TaxID=1176177 RepID=A0A7W6APK2_9HYPH|nr:MT-A70 family methyltransferase [Methylobacterium brachythecii]MBB3905099.1 N6-adenosine-specific RNA methylase IME4 [Methylobacterium brachythecii]GLS44393.1 DNA methyltransferase [Methylobacterium brachythecii]
MTWAFGDLRPLSYDLIVADPPWKYEAYSERGEKKGAAAQYSCLQPEEIGELFPVHLLAGGNCLLGCFGTWPLFDRQLACIRAWGFTFRSVVVWEKVFASGKSAIGTGYRVRSMCEPVLLATIGEPRHKAFPGLFSGIRREHSRKPDEFYSLVDDRCPRLFRRADLFARETRHGWEAFGNEATKFDPAPLAVAAE